MTLSTTLSENTGACGVVKLITKLDDVAAASAANVRRAGATACLATWKIVRPSMLDGTGRMFGSWSVCIGERLRLVKTDAFLQRHLTQP